MAMDFGDRLLQDLRYGLRMLISKRGLTAVAVLSVARWASVPPQQYSASFTLSWSIHILIAPRIESEGFASTAKIIRGAE
jgi:hypothetical protein